MKTKKRPLSKLKKDLDDLWSLEVRARDGNRCLMCGKTHGLSAHHWIVRKARSLATRWLISNGATLCYYCHIVQLHGFGDKAFVEKFYARMESIVPRASQDEIERLGHTIWKPCRAELEDMVAALRRSSDARKLDNERPLC